MSKKFEEKKFKGYKLNNILIKFDGVNAGKDYCFSLK